MLKEIRGQICPFRYDFPGFPLLKEIMEQKEASELEPAILFRPESLQRSI
jgi:hypothetical protein